MSGNRILVTGGSGFIGSALVKALLRGGNHVRVLDDNSRGSPRRLADVAADVEFVAADIREAMAATAHDVPNGASVALRGQVTTMTSAYQQLFVGLALAIVLIYLLIVVNFQSWLDPFVIVMALPTALAGIVWILCATDTTLSVPALTGAGRPARNDSTANANGAPSWNRNACPASG